MLCVLQTGTGARAVRKRKLVAWSDDGSAAGSSGEQDCDRPEGPAAASGAFAAAPGMLLCRASWALSNMGINVDLRDIASALSRLARLAGHSSEPHVDR